MDTCELQRSVVVFFGRGPLCIPGTHRLYHTVLAAVAARWAPAPNNPIMAVSRSRSAAPTTCTTATGSMYWYIPDLRVVPAYMAWAHFQRPGFFSESRTYQDRTSQPPPCERRTWLLSRHWLRGEVISDLFISFPRLRERSHACLPSFILSTLSHHTPVPRKPGNSYPLFQQGLPSLLLSY